jgi:RNA exonuclease 1
MIHGRIVDTAVIYHSSRGPPSKPSLKYLAQRYLNKEIQQGTTGHDSIQDANTCMDLVKLKLEKGNHGTIDQSL